VEALPSDVLSWTDGRALVATGSPFAPITTESGTRVVGQANNVFIFPGVGLGAIVAEARLVTDEMFVAGARALAELVTAERFAAGGLYPPVAHLREVSRRIALAVAREARRAGVAGIADDVDLDAAVDAATWDPRYVDYLTDSSAPAAT
jgi:malic enzyme